MRAIWLAARSAIGAWRRAAKSAAPDPVIQVDFSNPGLSPSQWTMTLHPDGTGHFRSQMGKPPDDDPHGFDTPGVDRDIQVSAAVCRAGLRRSTAP